MQADLENGSNFFDQNDPNAGRNAIIEVLSTARTRGDLINYIKNRREAKAEEIRQAEYNEYARWCEENYHLSPEDYEAYEDAVVRDFKEKLLTDEEQFELDSQMADEIQAIQEELEEIDAILAQNRTEKMKTLKEMTKAEAMSYAKEAARYCKENNLLRPGEVEKLKQENRLAPVLIARMELHKKAHPEK